ncbi:MAG: DUF2807 domain-containing protein [Muribaculaceae bacterium]|nr:DUF2807 domain-containing protein [Muribaculaceae bacterium]
MKKVLFAIVILALVSIGAVVTIGAMAYDSINVKMLSNNVVTREISVPAFQKIEVSRVDLVLTPGPANGIVRLEAPENIAPHINVKVKDKKLVIELDDKVQWEKGRINSIAYVTVPYVSSIDASLASKVEILSDMAVEKDAKLEVATAAEIKAKTISAGGKFKIEANTAGIINLAGIKAGQNCEIESNTAAKVIINSLSAAKADIEANTAGKVELASGFCTKVDFDANTGGSINAGALDYRTGEAEANTGGIVRCNSSKLSSIETATGGRVQSR